MKLVWGTCLALTLLATTTVPVEAKNFKEVTASIVEELKGVCKIAARAAFNKIKQAPKASTVCYILEDQIKKGIEKACAGSLNFIQEKLCEASDEMKTGKEVTADVLKGLPDPCKTQAAQILIALENVTGRLKLCKTYNGVMKKDLETVCKDNLDDIGKAYCGGALPLAVLGISTAWLCFVAHVLFKVSI